MLCNHERYMSKNNRFICLLCGAEIPNPYKGKQQEQDAPKAQEKPAKRRAKKEAK